MGEVCTFTSKEVEARVAFNGIHLAMHRRWRKITFEMDSELFNQCHIEA